MIRDEVSLYYYSLVVSLIASTGGGGLDWITRIAKTV
jgi:hypothetical protein